MLMKNSGLKSNQHVATCPACGLLCDDILVESNQNKIKVLAKGCAKSVTFFEHPINATSPKIAGKSVSLEAAVTHAAGLLKLAKQPLFTGLSTDIAGFRSLFNLAQKTDGNLQHMNATSMARNLAVLQSTGWQTTTLTELKNRADVILCIGSDIVTHNPRFFERFVWLENDKSNAMFTDAASREIIYIGENLNTEAGISPKGARTLSLVCSASDLPEITIVLRALVAGKNIKAESVAGLKVRDLQTVADKLKRAKYAVLAWIAKDLDFTHAELTIQNITETVSILNQTTRAAGLPLGGSDGDSSTNNAHTWLSGLALNNAHVEHDCMVWVNSFSAEKQPPQTNKPLIAFGNTDSKFATEPDVFIPIASPGMDSNGTLFRVDSSVILPLKKLRENDLPTLNEVVNRIEGLL
jgi:formylmethanofuran dehydrogenase subunit B